MSGALVHKKLWKYELEAYVDPIEVKKTLEEHFRMEDEVISHVEEEIKSTRDESVKLLLRYIMEDEKKQHRIL